MAPTTTSTTFLTNDVHRLRTHRESVGVQLYAMQQQLARLQVALEQTHADFNGLGEGRARAELDADSAKRRYTELKENSEALSKRLVKNEVELNALQETLRQVSQSRGHHSGMRDLVHNTIQLNDEGV